MATNKTPTPEPVSPAQIVADADQEITDAEDLVDALEQRVQDGDETVDADQVEKARGLARFARLRKVAAEKKAAALEETQRAAEFEDFVSKTLAGIAASITDEEIDAEEQKIAVQIKALDDRVMARNRLVYALAHRGDPVNTFPPTPAAELLHGQYSKAPSYASFTYGEHSGTVYPGSKLLESINKRAERLGVLVV